MAYSNGGAPTAVWGWILVCSMTMTVVSTLDSVLREDTKVLYSVNLV